MNEHTPKPGTFYYGGTFAKCVGCGQTIIWAAVGTPEQGYSETAWRGNGSTKCPGLEQEWPEYASRVEAEESGPDMTPADFDYGLGEIDASGD